MLALSTIFVTLIYTTTLILAQTTLTVVCIAGQCIQGYSNTTLGARLSAPGAPSTIQLLPGQYTTTTSPQLLHDILTSPSASLTPSSGFNVSSDFSLPLNLGLQPGLATYTDPRYSGQAAFVALSDSTPNSTIDAGSIALSSNVWVAVNSGPNNRLVLWDSVPDVLQLPSSNPGPFSLVDVQSAACSPPCSGAGVCAASATCTCPQGFTGSSCETCAQGFFGPDCQPCPADCETCDEGVSGTGRCLKPLVANAPATCSCLNGVCGSNGQCTCNSGFTTADDGTACAKCTSGFFLTSTGDCQVCQLGCDQCADGTGVCLACRSGFTQDGSDRTKCNPPRSVTSTGTACPDGAFSNGNSCSPCSSSCQTCTGGTSNDCIVCASGRFTLNGSCVGVNSEGVCEGTNLLADNVKRRCDSCPAKCTTCGIQGFNVGSLPSDVQCTGCLPGFVVSDGKCVESCPSATFLSPQDNLNCLPCDSSCGTCAGTSAFCLTCSGNQLASNGSCTASCPADTFSSSGSCLSCHSDCATCSGNSFNQCTSCPSSRPVLVNGRCLPTCARSQYFDAASSSCQTCDSSCSSCSGSGPSNCLACSSSSQVLRGGSCTFANCKQANVVVSGLGVCLSELVTTDNSLPPITGLEDPTTLSTRRPLEWWQILLMTLGCAFIFLVILWFFRRRAQKQRAKRTAIFASTKGIGGRKGYWRRKVVPFGEKLFGHISNAHHGTDLKNKIVMLPSTLRVEPEGEAIKLKMLRAAEEARQSPDIQKDVEEDVATLGLIRTHSKPATPKATQFHTRLHRVSPANEHRFSASSSSDRTVVSEPSLYSQMTGVPRKTPEPRRPMRPDGELIDLDLEPRSRFSMSSVSDFGNTKGKGKEETSKRSFWK